MNYLSAVQVEPLNEANASVIWLHGLGANGHDFEPIVEQLALPSQSAIRFIFPHSPSMAVTINGGMIMPAWYDILDRSMDRKIDLTHLTHSASAVQALIDREIKRGIKSDRIIVAGFSQGGAVAFQTALTYPQPLAGLLIMSSYFATKDTTQLHVSNKLISINIMHGSLDPIVDPLLGKQATKTLLSKGFKPTYTEYKMEHNVCAQQIDDISIWLQQRLLS